VEHEYRVVWPDDAIRWLRNSIRPSWEANDRLRLDGVATDITKRKRGEERASPLRECGLGLSRLTSRKSADAARNFLFFRGWGQASFHDRLGAIGMQPKSLHLL
jgi:hypothetical protein